MHPEKSSTLTLICPTCENPLQLSSSGLRYGCRQGHQYSSRELDQALREQVYRTLSTTMRQVQEQERLLRLLTKHGLLPQSEEQLPLPPFIHRVLALLTNPRPND